MVRGIAVILLSLALLAPLRSEACSCAPAAPICEEFFNSTVFVGVALTTEDSSTTFQVLETLHSDAQLPETVKVAHPQGGCDASFRDGERYVVYASGRADTLSTWQCTRTHRLAPNDADVAFASAKADRTRAQVNGHVELFGGESTAAMPPVTIRAVSQTGDTVSTTSDGGSFSFELLPGNYTLVVDHPQLGVRNEEVLRVSLPSPKACAAPDLKVMWNGRIAGRVTEKGKPVVGLKVVPARAAPNQPEPWTTAVTDTDGRYLLEQLPPGAYRIGVSTGLHGTTPESPYPETWATTEARVGIASLVENINLELPTRHRVVNVRVRVRTAAGAPAAGVKVFADERTATTDALGECNFPELAGDDVFLSSCLDAACTQKQVRARQDTTVTLTIR